MWIFWVPKHYLLSGACAVKHLSLEAKIILNNLSLCRETFNCVHKCVCADLYKRGQAKNKKKKKRERAGSCRGQKKALGLLELESQTVVYRPVVYRPVWMLRAELRSSERAVCALSC